jgi:hypothetical protein
LEVLEISKPKEKPKPPPPKRPKKRKLTPRNQRRVDINQLTDEQLEAMIYDSPALFDEDEL